MKPRYPYTLYLVDAFRLLAFCTLILGATAAFITVVQRNDLMLAAILIIASITGAMVNFAIGAALDILTDVEEHLRILARRNRKE